MAGLVLPGIREELMYLPASLGGEAALLCHCCHVPAPSSMLGREVVPAGAAPSWCRLCRLTQGITLPGMAGLATAAGGMGGAGPGPVVALGRWRLSHAECLSAPGDSVPTPSHQWGN